MAKAALGLDAPQGTNWKTVAGWLGAAVLAFFGLRYFLLNATHYMVDFSQSSYRQYWPNRGYLFVHIVGGSLALLCGPFQIWSGLRRRVMKAHRAIGTAYLGGVAAGSLAAFYMAAVSPLRTFGIALAVLALAWLVTTSMAFLAIHNRHIDAHKEWMIRSYVITYGFVSFRVISGWNLFGGLGTEQFATIAWMCWTVPLLFAEVALQWKRTTA